jgi:ADP-ribosyl-[dinitrogen reductase] hydrolase
MIESSSLDKTIAERFAAGMAGLAVGEALGLEALRQNGAGQAILRYTGLALCLAESLTSKGMFHPADQLERYARWIREHSGAGSAFRYHSTISAALDRYERTGDMYSGFLRTDTEDAAALCRMLPVALFYYRIRDEAVVRSGDSALTTHGSVMSIDCCRYLSALMIGILKGESKPALFEGLYEPAAGFWLRRRLISEVSELAAPVSSPASAPARDIASIPSAPLPLQVLDLALYAWRSTDTFREGAELAIRMASSYGGAPEAGAVYGQLAGLYYGFDAIQGIPEEWLQGCPMREEAAAMAERLYRAALPEESRL